MYYRRLSDSFFPDTASYLIFYSKTKHHIKIALFGSMFIHNHGSGNVTIRRKDNTRHTSSKPILTPTQSISKDTSPSHLSPIAAILPVLPHLQPASVSWIGRNLATVTSERAFLRTENRDQLADGMGAALIGCVQSW